MFTMLEFDSSTLANMTAALDHGCKMLSAQFDTAENRKRLGNALVSAARSHKRSLPQLIEVAEGEVAAILDRSDGSFVGSVLKRLKLTIR
jgi:hypothetical protein